MGAAIGSAVDSALFLSDLALIRNRPAFDVTCAITVENIQALLAEYHGAEWANCQVERDGKLCNHEFQNGWLARRDDGKEGMIGCDCAEKYFDANDRFRTERYRLNREIRIESHLFALQELLGDQAAYASRYKRASTRLRTALDELSELRDELPAEVVKALRDMVKTRATTVFVEVQYFETTEKGEQVSTWRRRDVGGVLGLVAWDETLVREVFTSLQRVREALDKVVVSKDQKESELRKWREGLEALPYCEREIERIDRGARDFLRPGNVALLCHLVANQTKQRDIARLTLKLSGERAPSDLRVQTRLNEILGLARERFKGCNFRVCH